MIFLRSTLFSLAICAVSTPVAQAITYEFDVTSEPWRFDSLQVEEYGVDAFGNSTSFDRDDLMDDTTAFYDFLLTDPGWAAHLTTGLQDTLFFGMAFGETARAEVRYNSVIPATCASARHCPLSGTLEAFTINGIDVRPARYLLSARDDGTDVYLSTSDQFTAPNNFWMSYRLDVTGSAGLLDLYADWGALSGMIGDVYFYANNPETVFSVSNFQRVPDPAPVPLPLSAWLLLVGLGGLGGLKLARPPA